MSGFEIAAVYVITLGLFVIISWLIDIAHSLRDIKKVLNAEVPDAH